MRSHHGVMRVDFSATFAQVTNQFFACFELATRGLIAVEITDETNTERNVVQVIAVDMTAVDLAPPTIADLDLTVAGGGAVADDEMVSQSILHPAYVTVVIIENARAALPGPAVMHDDELPATPHHRRAIDFAADRS